MSWFPGFEQKYNRFRTDTSTEPLARSFRVFAYREALRKPGPVGVVEARYHDIDTPWLTVRPSIPRDARPGESAQDTLEQIGG